MIFQHTIDKVLSGEKTQTRRLHTPGKQAGSYSDGRYWAVYGKMGNPPLWEVDHAYAVQPGRGKKQVARIRILDIRTEDVREINDTDATAEGFNTYRDFLTLWIRMHDKRWWMPKQNNDANMAFCLHRHMMGFRFLMERPAERYQAWVLTFELVKP